uniref:Uncharacterized protein n=1 Tax=Sphaeramia orbicularis TaxID=375764 RepID=A0A673CGX1_9TELE
FPLIKSVLTFLGPLANGVISPSMCNKPYYISLNLSLPCLAGYTIRSYNVSEYHTPTVFQPVMVTHPSKYVAPLCFTLRCWDGAHFLGTTRHCNHTTNGTCGYPRKFPCLLKSRVPHHGQVTVPVQHHDGNWHVSRAIFYLPNDDGFGSLTATVWVCGQNVYQFLPPNWCGVCHLARLLPDVRVVGNLTYSHPYYPHVQRPIHSRVRRGSDPKTRVRIKQWEKGVGAVVPMWGLPKLAHYIDDIAVDLEDVTKSVTEGFSAVSAEIKALRNVALQNRAALDYVLASSGGVCHVIGQECCTFIPDVSGNLTYVVDHLNELLIRQFNRDAPPPEGFDLWNWLTSGPWWQIFLKIATPFLAICVVLCLCSCCLVPLIRKIISSMLNATLLTYQLVPTDSKPVPQSAPPSDFDPSDFSDSD